MCRDGRKINSFEKCQAQCKICFGVAIFPTRLSDEMVPLKRHSCNFLILKAILSYRRPNISFALNCWGLLLLSSIHHTLEKGSLHGLYYYFTVSQTPSWSQYKMSHCQLPVTSQSTCKKKKWPWLGSNGDKVSKKGLRNYCSQPLIYAYCDFIRTQKTVESQRVWGRTLFFIQPYLIWLVKGAHVSTEIVQPEKLMSCSSLRNCGTAT